MSFFRAILATAAIVAGSAASATTVQFFNVTVTASSFTPPPVQNAPSATLPAVGDTGNVSIILPGITTATLTPIGDPNAAPNAGSVIAAIQVGSLTSALEAGSGAVAFVSDTVIRFSNGNSSPINVNFPRDPGATPTYAGSFVIETPADGMTPTTMGDIAAALVDPAAKVTFSFSGTTFDGIDTSFQAMSSPTIAPVPLPASGLLLGAVVLAGAGLSRRRRQRG